MTKTPSALQWLAEKRARLAGDLEQSRRVAEELGQHIEQVQFQVTAMDETIRIYYLNLIPERIAPVNAWQGRYGKLGEYRQALSARAKGYSRRRCDLQSPCSHLKRGRQYPLLGPPEMLWPASTHAVGMSPVLGIAPIEGPTPDWLD